jgi:hypothetical protein
MVRDEGCGFWDFNPISLPGDNGGLRAPRTLEKLIAAEQDGA